MVRRAARAAPTYVYVLQVLRRGAANLALVHAKEGHGLRAHKVHSSPAFLAKSAIESNLQLRTSPNFTSACAMPCGCSSRSKWLAPS